MTYKALNSITPQYLNEYLITCVLACLVQSKYSGCLLVPRIMKATAESRALS